MTKTIAHPRLTTWLALAVFLAVTFAVAAIGSSVPTGAENAWFTALNKPPIFPPSIVFPLVWTPLYVLMAVAAWLVWRAAGERLVWPAHGLWAVQLALNGAWTWLFFGFGQMGWALAEIVVMWFAILATAFAFARWSKPAAWMLAPYLAWVAFATVLNGWFLAVN